MAGASSLVALAQDWNGALERSAFWSMLVGPGVVSSRILILIDLAGARAGDPNLIEPSAVEALIELIHSRSGVTPALAASADESQFWAGNRDVYALADLLGYRFTTDGDLDYDIVDLGENLIEAPFRQGAALCGTLLSADWLNADVRLNLARVRPDAAEGFSAGLLNLRCCLPLKDKALHYRHRRELGAVISDVLDLCPPHHTLLDAGSGGSESNGEASSYGRMRFAVASSSPLLADYAAALKVGLDPFSSPLVEAVASIDPLPTSYVVNGSLEPVEALAPPRPFALRSTQLRQSSEAGDRLLDAWLKPLDSGIFPATRPLDAKARQLAADLVGNGSSPTGNAILMAANLAVAGAGQAMRAWRTLFDKDALVRPVVSIGIDPEAVPFERYQAVAPELEALLPIAAAAPEHAPGLRWRKFEKAVLFQYRRSFAIPFGLFVEKVDVSRTIEFMNDYLAGVVVVLDRDAMGRSIRQAERNLYLPQPNYLILYGGEPIDVTKIETVRYEQDAHRLYWKTICSSNRSASADDGVAFFEREGGGTRITIAGKQRFSLPPAMQLLDVSMWPDVEALLTTSAYQRFFERTAANLEALIEGRSIRIGHAPDEETAQPSIQLEAWLGAIAERAGPLIDVLKGASHVRPAPDVDGFVHVVPRR